MFLYNRHPGVRGVGCFVHELFALDQIVGAGLVGSAGFDVIVDFLDFIHFYLLLIPHDFLLTSELVDFLLDVRAQFLLLFVFFPFLEHGLFQRFFVDSLDAVKGRFFSRVVVGLFMDFGAVHAHFASEFGGVLMGGGTGMEKLFGTVGFELLQVGECRFFAEEHALVDFGDFGVFGL